MRATLDTGVEFYNTEVEYCEEPATNGGLVRDPSAATDWHDGAREERRSRRHARVVALTACEMATRQGHLRQQVESLREELVRHQKAGASPVEKVAQRR